MVQPQAGYIYGASKIREYVLQETNHLFHLERVKEGAKTSMMNGDG